MNSFTDYLQEKGYSNSTIKTYGLVVDRFLLWLTSENLTVEVIDYKQVLSYVKYLKSKHLNQSTIIGYMVGLKWYYSYLIHINQVGLNPFIRLKLRDQKRQSIRKVLGLEVLDYLYESYPNVTLSHKRNKMILGLLVYQGLSVRDLQLLTTESIDLLLGRIDVPQGLKTAGRSLDLLPVQILALKDYIENIRPELHPISEQVEQLFIGRGGRLKLDNVISRLTRSLKDLHPEFSSLQVIRNTRITYWVQTEGLRKAQYKAGHRYISSTEKYKPIKDDSLFMMVNQFHPIR